MTHDRRTTALVLTTLLLTTSLVAAMPTAMANHNVQITSPAGGTVLQRGVSVLYSASASLGTSPATCTNVTYAWSIGGAALAGPSVSYAFPLATAPGNKTVTVTATYTGASHCGNDRTASITVDVRNVAPTASLSLPATVVAGDALVADGGASSDADGSVASFLFTVDGVAQPAQATPTLPLAFTTAGPHVVALSVVDNDGGVSGTATRTVTVQAGPLASIAVDGPSVLVAGTTGTYALAGADAHGNPVALSQATLVHTAGTAVGQETVTYTEDGVTGQQVVDVVADALATIDVTGPASLVVGTSATYDLAGKDPYGNPVPLAQSTLHVVAPTVAGPFDVTYEESGVTGTLAVEAVAGALARIELVGPSEVVVGSTTTYDLVGTDAYGNAVPLAQETLDLTASTWAGTEWLCHVESGVEGCLFVTRVPDAPTQLLVGGPGIVVAGTTNDYTLTLLDQHGNLVRQDTVAHTASTTAGEETVIFVVEGLSASIDTRVEPDAIASLWIEGPTVIDADDVPLLFARGADQYGNEVVFSESFPYHFPSNVAGTYTWTITEGGLTATHTYEVVAGALRSIVLSGPSTMVANTTATFDVQGFDQWGNPIPMDPATVDVTAPRWAGAYYHNYEDDGIFTQTVIQVLPDAIASVFIPGILSGVVGTTLDATAVGRDQHGNVVRIENFTVTLPTQSGFLWVAHEMDGVEGTSIAFVLPDVLATLTLSGPTVLVAGATQTYDLLGSDQYGNAVHVENGTLTYVAPTLAGAYTVEATVDGVTGTLDVTVVADALASIVVTGPETLVAGGEGEYAFAGHDQHGNAVTLETTGATVPAPEQAGPTLVCHEEQGIEGCLAVLVVPDALATITLDGPTTLVVGSAATYALTGGDRFGNRVALAQDTLLFEAPTTVGTATVTYEEAGVVGSLVVDLVHGPVASIAVETSHDAQNLGRAVQASALAYDAYGNGIPEAVFAWSATHGDIDGDGRFVATSEGLATLVAAYDGATGEALVLVVSTLDVAVATTQATYGQLDALSGVSGEGQVAYVDGAPVAGVAVTLTFARADGTLPAETLVALTDDDGRFSFEAPAAARLAGAHVVTASAAAGGNAGEATAAYDVTPLPVQDAAAALL